MNDKDTLIMEALDARVKRREERRKFFRAAGGATVALAGTSLLAACGGGSDDDDDTGGGTPPPTGGTPTPTPGISDVDILNFALNLEYLEAQFYSFASFGTGLPANLLTGSNGPGPISGGQQVNFTDPQVRQYAREIALDERAHVAFLRQAIGSAVVAQPNIDIRGGAGGPFAAAAVAAGLPNGASFDPYASDENFLLGAFIFEDIGVTAYKGASPLITNKTFLGAAAGILGAEAYHASLIRTTLFAKGIRTPAPQLIDATERISNARDSLDGASDLDQGVQPKGDASNIVPADANGIAFSRTPGQVLSIVYLKASIASGGGFFPNGVNGPIRQSGV